MQPISRLAGLLQAWDDRVQTDACIVRQVQQQLVPEFIRPDRDSSTLALTPAALEVHMVRLPHRRRPHHTSAQRAGSGNLDSGISGVSA